MLAFVNLPVRNCYWPGAFVVGAMSKLNRTRRTMTAEVPAVRVDSRQAVELSAGVKKKPHAVAGYRRTHTNLFSTFDSAECIYADPLPCREGPLQKVYSSNAVNAICPVCPSLFRLCKVDNLVTGRSIVVWCCLLLAQRYLQLDVLVHQCRESSLTKVWLLT